MNYEPQPGYAGAPQKTFPWGCLFGGCLVVMFLMVGGVGATGFFAYRFYQSQMARYTSSQAEELPKVDFTEEQIAELETRVEDFQEDIEAKTADTQSLILTEAEVNALISTQEEFKDRVYVRIEDGAVAADVSVPLDMLPGGRGRFFNGSVTLDVKIEDGELLVYLEDASVNGEEIPSDILTQIQKENLAKDLNKDGDSRKWIRRFKDLQIEENQIVLTPIDFPKPEQDGTSAPETSAEVGADAEWDTDAVVEDGEPVAEATASASQGEVVAGTAPAESRSTKSSGEIMNDDNDSRSQVDAKVANPKEERPPSPKRK